jgi:hypothetical protein
MSMSHIFNVFSRRPEAAAKERHEVPDSTRHRIALWWSEMITKSFSPLRDMRPLFWAEIYKMILLRHGTPELVPGHPRPGGEEALYYLLHGPGEHFLNFLEDIFCTEFFEQMNVNANAVVDQLNELLRVDDLPYHLTSKVTEVREVDHRGRKCFASVGTGIYLRSG